ncbi:GntR family transcriptional regulator [Planctomicrobium piriforme]|uniref:DNA-binding transcriptional regulator, GntR family n=1 Tax=Planctomicrobium piriforme TaxID=1576369 RepID=A0A1I3B420_9PLAN|nr:GntR family transcriptional regulator [Planctomicrobium piriforme]SFH57055.1 DNA-binding transcriptional regulator, GntR family [Planctomicrobium piriforme]
MTTLGKPLERQSLSTVVQERLSRAIVSGELAAGERLREPELATRLGVSRAPVREALIGLEFAGLVLSDERGHSSVPVMQADDLQEIFLVRLALEPVAMQQASLRLSKEVVAALKSNIERTRSVETLAELGAIDVEFHDLIVQASELPRLRKLWSFVRYQIELWLNQMQPLVSENFAETRNLTVKSHLQLVKAFQSGDADAAFAAMRQHITGWQSHLADGQAVNSSNT